MHLDVLFVIFIYPSIVYVSFQKKKEMSNYYPYREEYVQKETI
jgi:hypothetical protein